MKHSEGNTWSPRDLIRYRNDGSGDDSQLRASKRNDSNHIDGGYGGIVDEGRRGASSWMMYFTGITSKWVNWQIDIYGYCARKNGVTYRKEMANFISKQ